MSPLPEGCWQCCGRFLGRNVICPRCGSGKFDAPRKAEPAKAKPGEAHEIALAEQLDLACYPQMSFGEWLRLAERNEIGGGGACVSQYPWGLSLSEPRKFKSDFAFPFERILVEIDGGAHAAGKAKQRKDTERRGLAGAAGWRVVAVTPEQVHDRSALALIRKALAEPE